MAAGGEGPGQAVQAQVHTPTGEGVEQIIKIHRLRQAGDHLGHCRRTALGSP
jgi:hypothetical protein